ncbi:hypothetical protein EG834_07550 [bacterium]|nr:hypothetical protein [bacterium]
MTAVSLCGYAMLFVRSSKLKWWVRLSHFFSSLLIGVVVSILVLVGIYYLPHGKWQKTNPAPEPIARIEILPNSIEPAIVAGSGSTYVYDCQADAASKISCAWVKTTGEIQKESDDEQIFEDYRFFAPTLLRKPVETVLSTRMYADAIDSARFVRFDDQVVHYWVRMWNSYAIFIRVGFALMISLAATIAISISLSAQFKKSGSVQRPLAGTEAEA